MADIGKLMEAAQRMQREMARVQEELGKKTVEASAGGGMVVAVVNGRQEVVSLRIDPAVPGISDPKDRGMLEDLVVAAINQGIARARAMAEQEMAKLAGGLNIPGLPGLG